MRIAILVILAAVISGCHTSYKQTNTTEPSVKLTKGRSVVIATPANGFYGKKEYPASGKQTALAVQTAFTQFAGTVTVSADCKDLQCLKASGTSTVDYYVVPQIIRWEDRATEWSNVPDRVEIKLSIYDGQSGKELAATVISGKSKAVTFTDDHPQHLLPEPLKKYVQSLY